MGYCGLQAKEALGPDEEPDQGPSGLSGDTEGGACWAHLPSKTSERGSIYSVHLKSMHPLKHMPLAAAGVDVQSGTVNGDEPSSPGGSRSGPRLGHTSSLQVTHEEHIPGETGGAAHAGPCMH